jgi:trk system potassium uptake protein TrkH
VVRVFGVLLCLLRPGHAGAADFFLHGSGDGAESAYDEAFLLTFGTGTSLWWSARKETHELKVRDGFLHGGAGVVGPSGVRRHAADVPARRFIYRRLLRGHVRPDHHRLDGAGGLDTLPPSINLWRGMLVWLGGMGLIVLAVAILPLLGIGGRQMFKAETPGPMKDSQLTPRMTRDRQGPLGASTAVVTVLCILSLHLAGMSWFDAVMHSFTTMGLGGFSSHDASFGFWNSPAIEAVT